MTSPIRPHFNVFADLLETPVVIGEHMATLYDNIESGSGDPKKETILNTTRRILEQAGITSEEFAINIPRKNGIALALDIVFLKPASFQPPNLTEEHHFHFSPLQIKVAASLLRTIQYPYIDKEVSSLTQIYTHPEEKDKITAIRVPNLRPDVGQLYIMDCMIKAIDTEAGWSGSGTPIPLQ